MSRGRVGWRHSGTFCLRPCLSDQAALIFSALQTGGRKHWTSISMSSLKQASCIQRSYTGLLLHIRRRYLSRFIWQMKKSAWILQRTRWGVRWREKWPFLHFISHKPLSFYYLFVLKSISCLSLHFPITLPLLNVGTAFFHYPVRPKHTPPLANPF